MELLNISRRLDTAEHFFWLLDKISCMNFVVFAEIAGKINSEHLRGALDLAQQAYPLLRVTIIQTPEHELHFKPTEYAINLQSILVTQQNWQEPIEHELAHPFELGDAPLMRCQYLHFGDQPRSVLALTFHHAIADGRSGTALLCAILRYLAQPETTIHFKDAAAHPPMHAAFPAQYQWDRQPQAAATLAGLRKADIKRHGRSHPLPWLDQQQPLRLPHFKQLMLNATNSIRLFEQCKKHGATLHGALGAAQLLAKYKSIAATEALALGLSSPADMRAYLAPEIPASSLGLYVTLLFSVYQVGGAQSFWDLARQVSADIRRQLERGDGHLFFTQIKPEAFPPTAEGIAAFGHVMLSTPHSSMISNIGKVASIDARANVTSISFVLCPVPYQIVFSGVSTYNDKLIINITYDAAKLAPARADQLAQWMLQALQEACI